MDQSTCPMRQSHTSTEIQTHVFNEIHRSPADLGSKIFHGQFSALSYSSGSQRCLVGQCLSVIFQAQFLASRIELAEELGLNPVYVQESHTLGYLAANASLTSAIVAVSRVLLVMSISVGKSGAKELLRPAEDILTLTMSGTVVVVVSR